MPQNSGWQRICIYRPVKKNRVSQICGRIIPLFLVSNSRLYQKAVSGDAYPWCMVYVSWVFAHVNTDIKATTTSTKKSYTGSYPNLSNVSRKYLKKGDKGKEVTKWQKFLNWAGYNCGKADGVFGDKTVGATKSFQYKNGLTADGFVGAKTISKAKETKK